MNQFLIALTVARKEFRTSLRDRVFLLLALLIVCLTTAAFLTGMQRHRDLRVKKEKAAKMFREEWEHQHANPHSAAHFGTYLFKPDSYLSIYDNGLTNFLGNYYRVEAHLQHDVNQSVAEDTDSGLRFGELSVAMVFQLLVPLLILFVAFNTLSRERESLTLRMLLVQGVKPAVIVWGKIGGVYLLVLAIVLPVMLLMFLPVAFGGQWAMTGRYLLFALSYIGYFLIFTVLFVLVSALVKSSGASMVTGLAIWLLFCVLMPRLSIRIIDAAHPLPSRYELNLGMSLANSKGMNKDGNRSERYARYLAETLKKYGVDSVKQLPVNFDGLSMQMGEDYNARVYERYAGDVEKTIRQQQSDLGFAGLLNPYISQQQVSMGLAGTDYGHHLAFHHQAKNYRDEFVRILNMELANSGSAYLTYNYQVGPEFFSKMADFNYRSPATADAVKTHAVSWLSLLLWIVLLCVSVPIISNRLT